MNWIASLFSLAVVALLTGCGEGKPRPGTVPVSWVDPRVTPLLQAMAQVDRARMGFSEFPKSGPLYLEQGGADFDAMLHIDQPPIIRTVSFRKTKTGYLWLDEQELHLGPHEHYDLNRSFKEAALIECEFIPGSEAAPMYRVKISYLGPDPRLAGRTNLALADIKPVFAEWSAKH